MVNNSHQYQQSKQSPLESDGQQFTPISTCLCWGACLFWWYWCELLTITVESWLFVLLILVWSVDHLCLDVIVCFVDIVVKWDTDGQQFTPISTKQTVSSMQWWSTIHTNISKTNNHLILVWVVDHLCLEVIVCFVDIGVNCWPSLSRGDCLFCW
jgi:hypothetical protein